MRKTLSTMLLAGLLFAAGAATAEDAAKQTTWLFDRLDNIGGNAPARGETENRAGVLGDVGLEKGDTHDRGAFPHWGHSVEFPPIPGPDSKISWDRNSLTHPEMLRGTGSYGIAARPSGNL